jgi:hypothetical protein
MSEPAIKRLAEKLPMEDDFSNENFDIPAWPGPESSPASPGINLELLPFGGIFCPFEASLQPDADMEAHTPYEQNQRWEKHHVENKVFVHSPSIEQFGVV